MFILTYEHKYTCVHMYMCICTYIHTYIYAYLLMYMYIRVHMYVYMCTCVHVYQGFIYRGGGQRGSSPLPKPLTSPTRISQKQFCSSRDYMLVHVYNIKQVNYCDSPLAELFQMKPCIHMYMYYIFIQEQTSLTCEASLDPTARLLACSTSCLNLDTQYCLSLASAAFSL